LNPKILNHVESGVTTVYDRHSYDAEKRAALALGRTWRTFCAGPALSESGRMLSNGRMRTIRDRKSPRLAPGRMADSIQ